MSFVGGQLLTCFYGFMTALFAALIMVPFLRQWALDQGTMDFPDQRKVHTVPMPRLGGIAIFLAFLFSTIIFLPIQDSIRGLLAGTLVIFATGVVDDLNGLRSRSKFVGQIAACLTTVLVGRLYLTDLGDLFGLGRIDLPVWAGVLFTVFAVVGVINAINLIDGLDGLAGGVSSIALTAFFLLGWLENDPVTMILSAAMIGAILGFLKDNFYPARIFMGDTGSMVVGYVLAFIAVYTTQRPGSTISPMVPVMVLGLPLLDTVWVMMRRVLRGHSPFVADRTHVHHKFLDLGFEHRFTVIIIYGISLFWAIFALLLRGLAEYQLLLFYLATALSCYLLLRGLLLRRQRLVLLESDGSSGLRSSKFYQRLCEKSQNLRIGIQLLLGLYLALSFGVVFIEPLLPWPIALVLLGGAAFLWFGRVSDNRQFMMLIVYAVFGMAATQVWAAESVLVGSLTVKRCGDLLLGGAAALAVLKLQFRQEGEFFLTMADYLVLAICIFLAIASQQAVLGFSINGPLFRTVLGIVTVRTLVSADRSIQTVAFLVATGLLVAVILTNLLAR